MKPSILAVIACLFLLSSCAPEQIEEQKPPNILMIVIDSVRARNLGCYGYERNTSPNIDSLAAEGTLWENCVAQSSWTLPSFSSILTGTSERVHGAGRRFGVEYMLPRAAPYLPMLLRNEGFRTYGHFNVVYLDRDHGFSRGFDSYHCARESTDPANFLVDNLVNWLDEMEEDERFLAVLHFNDPHMPYNPPAPYDSMFGPRPEELLTRWRRDADGNIITEDRETFLSLYDGEIAFTDAELGRLFSYLRTSGLGDNTIVVVTADHGQEFLEHGGTFHGHAFYQEITHVPLIINGPGVPRGVVESEWVGLFDLAPTILTLLGLDVPEVMEGSDLFSPLPQSIILPSSGLFDPPHTILEPWVCAVVVDGIKTLRFEGGDAYIDLRTDLTEDPYEQALSLIGNSVTADEYMLRQRLWEPVSVERDTTLSPILRDLGYF